MVGLQVNGIKPGSLFQEIGLQEGDVITQFNGIAINSPDQSAQDLPGARERSGIQRGRARRRWHRVDQELHAGVSGRVADRAKSAKSSAARLRGRGSLARSCSVALGRAARRPGAGAARRQPRRARHAFEPGAMVTLDFADAELAQVIETIARAHQPQLHLRRPRARPRDDRLARADPGRAGLRGIRVGAPGEGLHHGHDARRRDQGGAGARGEGDRASRRCAARSAPPNRDRFVTRLIPLRYIDADSIVEHAEAARLEGRGDGGLPADQHGDPDRVRLEHPAPDRRSSNRSTSRPTRKTSPSSTSSTPTPRRSPIRSRRSTAPRWPRAAAGVDSRRARAPAARPIRTTRTRGRARDKPPVRILTDERTNSLLVLAPRPRSSRRCAGWSRSSTCRCQGGGRIHVYYLNNANAEELAETLAGLVGGGGGGGSRATARRRARRGTGGAQRSLGGAARARRPRSAPRSAGSRAGSA